jgi:hypothetical protein
MKRLLPPALVAAALLACAAPALASADSSYRGRLEIRHYDNMAADRSTTRYELVSGPRSEPLSLTRMPRVRSGSQVTVDGRATAGRIVGTVASGGVRAASVPAGPRPTAVVLINFADDQRQPWSVDQARQQVFTAPDSVNAFFLEESYGQVSLVGRQRADGDVFGWYTLPVSASSCNPDLWTSQARAAVRASGADLTSYAHVIYAFPPERSCNWSGLGELPGTQSWVNGSLAVRTVAHELEHNMGTHHASSYRCSDVSGLPVAISSNCTLDEYGDPFDVMGGFVARHSSAWHLQQLGFLPASHVQTVTGTGTYTVQSALAQGAPTQLIRIPRTRNVDGSVRDYYYLDLRSSGGIFDDFGATDPAVTGVAIRICPDVSVLTESALIDTTPGSPGGFSDAPLAAGRTFDDGTIAISNLSVAGGTATLKITVRSQPDTQPPSVPAGITATPQPGGGLRLAWQPSMDDFQVGGYRVVRNGSPLGTTSDPSFVDASARTGATYTYQLVAFDTAGNSSESAPFTVTVATLAAAKKKSARGKVKVSIRTMRRKRGSHRHVLRATARAATRVKRVELWVDGRKRASARGSKLTFQWSVAKGHRGRHSVLVRAIDASGDVGSRTLKMNGPPVRAKIVR